MRKRIFMLLAVALMLVAAMALSGVAQAASSRDMCQQAAESLTGKDLTDYTFVVGTTDSNTFSPTNGRAEVFCGFDGGDRISHLKGVDIFIGGAGRDSVGTNNGDFYGGAGGDSVDDDNYRTFYGGDGNDSVDDDNYYGTFNGGVGNDRIAGTNFNGDFNGGAGGDSVDKLISGTFNGGVGVDYIVEMFGGTFDGGDDTDDDYVVDYYAGHLVNVP